MVVVVKWSPTFKGSTSVEPWEVGITSVSSDSLPTESLNPDTIAIIPLSQQVPRKEQIISEISRISVQVVMLYVV